MVFLLFPRTRTNICLPVLEPPSWKKNLNFQGAYQKYSSFFSRGLSAIMTTLCVSEGNHGPHRFAPGKWGGVFFLEINTMTPQGPPRMQIQKCIQVPLKLIRNSIAKCPPKSATRAIFFENSFSVWNQKNLLKRFYWMPGAGRAKIFSTHLAPKLY